MSIQALLEMIDYEQKKLAEEQAHRFYGAVMNHMVKKEDRDKVKEVYRLFREGLYYGQEAITRIAHIVDPSLSPQDQQFQMDPILREKLAELVGATTDRTSHFARYPRNNQPGHYNSDKAPEEEVSRDWSRVLRRHEMAIQALNDYGRSMIHMMEEVQTS